MVKPTTEILTAPSGSKRRKTFANADESRRSLEAHIARVQKAKLSDQSEKFAKAEKGEYSHSSEPTDFKEFLEKLDEQGLRDLILEFLHRASEEQLQRVENHVRNDPLLTSLFNDVVNDNAPPPLPLPTVAPALWKERTSGREVTPVDFVKMHYAPWLGKRGGLTIPILGNLDPQLCSTYITRIKNHPSEDLDIPNSMDETDRLATKYGLMRDGKILIDSDLFRVCKTLVRRIERNRKMEPQY